jgi:RNA recognition motif-containing protein
LLGSLDGTMARVFVGDLSYDTTDNQLRAQYEEYGVVVDAQVQLLAARCCKNKN